MTEQGRGAQAHEQGEDGEVARPRKGGGGSVSVVINETGITQVWDGYVIPRGRHDIPERVAKAIGNRPGYSFEPLGPNLYFLAPFRSCEGYGSQAEDLVVGWDSLGVALTVRNLWEVEPKGLHPRVLELLSRPGVGTHEVGLCFATAGEFQHLPTEYRVGLTMWETDRPAEVHPQWTWQMNELDLLLTPSEWCKQVWKRSNVYSPIKVVELSAAHRFYEAPLWEQHDRKEFVVVSWAMMTVLKSPREMIGVFQKAFPRSKYPDCRLKIKTHSGWFGGEPGDFPQVTDDRVEIINETWSFEQLVSFARSADVGLFLSKGEGWGRPGREAVALGLPSIITDNTGYGSICSSGDVVAIPTRKVVKAPSCYGGDWCIPDWNAAVDSLRELYSNREVAAERALKGSERYRREYSPERVGQKILDALEGVTSKPSKRSQLSKSWAGFYSSEGEVDLRPVRHIQEHHKRFFDYIVETFPKSSQLLETGVGTGSFFAALSACGFSVSAIENDPKVIVEATKVLEKLGVVPQIISGDTFELNGHQADVIYHQGLLEHFKVHDVLKIIGQQLGAADRVVFSVPSIYYPTRDFGNENLRGLEWWQKVVSRHFDVKHSEYYGGAGDRWHVLLDVATSDRGSVTRRL